MFEYLAIWSAKRARGKPFRVMVMLIVITAVASALLDNVTTVLLIAPVTLLVCERLALRAGAVPDRRGDGLQHRRHRDPGRRPAEHHHRQPRAGLTFNDFLVNLAPLVVVLMVVFCRAVPDPVPRRLHLRPGQGGVGDDAQRA